jgi:predicted NAD-dependent protein-ADP-ribosyltransferase YbiA (DUF1768 family)
MVLSKINPNNVNYVEDKKMDSEDIEYSTFSYEDSLYKKNIEIALGKEKHTHSRHDIVFYPVYLIVDSTPIEKIGIFEIESNKLINSIDEEGAIDLNNGNLLYYISEPKLNIYITSNTEVVNPDENVKSSDVKLTDNDFEDLSEIDPVETEDKAVMRIKLDDNNIKPLTESNDKGDETEKLFVINDSFIQSNQLEEEKEHDSNNENEKYKEGIRTIWIEKFMKNNNFGIIDNEGGGDCLFATLRDAFELVGRKTTIDKLRNALSFEATEEIYNNYRNLYLGFLNEYNDIEKQIKSNKKEVRTLKSRVDKSNKKEDNQMILGQVKELLSNEKSLGQSKNMTKEMMDEFNFIKDVNTFDEFKEYIKSSNYWGDTWAISTLERLANIKFIILSEEAFLSKPPDLDAIMQCGQINDEDIDAAKTFKPDYYIIISYTGLHYKLITYKKKGALKFKEIPYDIKSLVINKCLERNAGLYYLIPDFRNYKSKVGIDVNVGSPDDGEDDISNKDLYDNSDVLMFYSNSNARPKAGKGSGEKLSLRNVSMYKNLNNINDWRRKIDDSWQVPITISGMRWNSVHHYYLGSHYKKGFPDFYKQFSLDSGSDISENIEMAVAAVSKTGIYKKKQLRKTEIVQDSDFYEIKENPRHIIERELALEAKFTQNNDMKQLLLETHRSKLIQFKRGKEPILDEGLMKLRKKIL